MTPDAPRSSAALYRNLWFATLVALAFTLGMRFGEGAGGAGESPAGAKGPAAQGAVGDTFQPPYAGLLEAQGREPLPTPNGATPPPTPAVNVPGVGNLPIPDLTGIFDGQPTTPALGEGIYYAEGNQTGAAGNGILAVTGSYGIGTSVLYVVDTEKQQLAVYEARGGARGSRRLYLVGARRIDLDLQLLGYNDTSDYLYEDLQKRFADRPSAAGEPETQK